MIKNNNFAYSDKKEYQIDYGESKSYGLESLTSIIMRRQNSKNPKNW